MMAVDYYKSSRTTIAGARSEVPGLAAVAHDVTRPGLTPRERDVLDMVGLALTNREIAVRLCLSEKTVKRHVTMVMRKLGARNRVETALMVERQQHSQR